MPAVKQTCCHACGPTGRLAGWLACQHPGQPAGQPAGQLAHCLACLLASKHAVQPARTLERLQSGWLAGQFVGQLVCQLVRHPAGLLAGVLPWLPADMLASKKGRSPACRLSGCLASKSAESVTSGANVTRVDALSPESGVRGLVSCHVLFQRWVNCALSVRRINPARGSAQLRSVRDVAAE